MPTHGRLFIFTFLNVLQLLVILDFVRGVLLPGAPNFKTFIYPYKSFRENGDYDLSMKRISIHKENYRTSEITVPISEDRPSYFVERSCDGIIQYFFEKKHNRKLS